MIKIPKKLVGKYMEIDWEDPEEHTSGSLPEVLANPFMIHHANGKLVHCDNRVIVLEHDRHDDENGGDWTTIVPSLVRAFKLINPK